MGVMGPEACDSGPLWHKGMEALGNILTVIISTTTTIIIGYTIATLETGRVPFSSTSLVFV